MENSVMLSAVCNEPVSLKVLEEPFYRKGFSPFVNKETGTWWEYDDDKKGFFDTGIIAQGRDGDTVDVRIDGKSIVQDGVANIPKASDEILGAVCARADFGIGINENNGLLYTETASDLAIKNRQTRKVIAPTNFDYAVKCAMTDGIGAEWTADEQAAARERMGITRDYELIDTIKIDEDSFLDFTFPYPCKNVLIMGKLTKFAAKTSIGYFKINQNVIYPAPFDGIPNTFTTNTLWSVEIMTNGTYITIINTQSDNRYLVGVQKSTRYLSKESVSRLQSTIEFLAGTELIVYGARA